LKLKSFFTWVGLVVLLVFGAASSWGQDMKYSHKIESEQIVFEWQIEDKLIHIQLSAPTTGWVGIGFNPSKDMKDANFILGYVKNDKVRVSDEFGTHTRQHEEDIRLDGKENVTNAKGHEKDGMTTISFTIPLNSGDAKDRALTVGKDTHVLLAYGSGRDSFNTRHKVHVSLSVNLETGAFAKK
jgi:hypothetical protein